MKKKKPKSVKKTFPVTHGKTPEPKGAVSFHDLMKGIINVKPKK